MKDPEIINHECNEMPRKNLVIAWDGKISPCHLDVEMDLVIGDANNNKLNEVYENNLIINKHSICNNCIDGGVSNKYSVKGN